jgi:hypothetical protein
VRRVALLLLLLGLALPSPAHAAFPGRNGKIAFASNRDGNWEIYSVNPDGSGLTNLTHNPGSDLSPIWAPDGRSLVFRTDRDGSGTSHDYVMNADGSSPIFLCRDTSLDFALSPDGMEEVRSWTDRLVIATLMFTNTGDCDSRTLPSGSPAVGPAWSPDGTKIAYVVEAHGFGNGGPIHVINADGTGDVALTGDSSADSALDWSPTGDRIVFWRNTTPEVRGIYTMRPDGSDVTLVPGTALDYSPVWSPDGNRIAVLHNVGSASSPVYSLDTIATDGSDRVTVVGGSDAPRAPNWQPVTPQPPLYARPKGATPIQVSLVPSYKPCASPDREHGSPLVAGACSSPQQTSDFLTMGTLDSNGQPAKFHGLMQFDVIKGDPATTADEADVKVTASLADVRCKATYPTCDGGPLSDYGGALQGAISIKITDRFNGPPHPAYDAGTVASPISLTFAIPCNPTLDTTVGSNCALTTTLDSVAPRVVKEGVRSIWGLDRVVVTDGGPNGASFDESTLFAVQGVFVP